MGGNTLDNTKPFQKSTLLYDKAVMIAAALDDLSFTAEDDEAKILADLAESIAESIFKLGEKHIELCRERTLFDAAINAGEAVLKELREIKNDY